MLTRIALIGISSVTAAALTTGPALASPATVHVKSGTTKVTVAPAVARALLSNGVAPLVTRPGKPGLAVVGKQPTLTAAYPVTGGTLTTDPLAGTVKHQGGLKFVNVFNGRSLEVKDFTIDLTKGNLTAKVAGSATRVPVFNLDTSTASVDVSKHRLDARKVTLRLTSTAASALNNTLRTKVFATGLVVGTADTHLRF
ncbi:hypothetical protein [Streptomyces sp. NPDC088766]|uniref:hypothetical protein n=1 Tax=Streptomyces sp. NPDC088766 TaxID=3365893 RepID=UPI0037F12D0D